MDGQQERKMAKDRTSSSIYELYPPPEDLAIKTKHAKLVGTIIHMHFIPKGNYISISDTLNNFRIVKSRSEPNVATHW